MNIAEARTLLTDRHSRFRTGGTVYIGLSLDDAAEIADLLKVDPTPAPEYDLIPKVPEPTPEPERVVDTESGPVKVPEKKVAKKKVPRKAKKKAKGRKR